MNNETLQPEGWPRPKGYANGVTAQGRQVFTAGVVGWNTNEEFESDDIVEQFRQTLVNTVAILKVGQRQTGGYRPNDLLHHRQTPISRQCEQDWRRLARNIG